MVHPIGKYISYKIFSKSHLAFLAALDSDNEPRNYKEAMKDDCWRKAMAEEIQALEDMGLGPFKIYLKEKDL